MGFELSDYIDMDLTNLNSGDVFEVGKLNRIKILTHSADLVGIFLANVPQKTEGKNATSNLDS